MYEFDHNISLGWLDEGIAWYWHLALVYASDEL